MKYCTVVTGSTWYHRNKQEECRNTDVECGCLHGLCQAAYPNRHCTAKSCARPTRRRLTV